MKVNELPARSRRRHSWVSLGISFISVLWLGWGCGGGASPLGPHSGRAWTNSLGMVFVPVNGTRILFCIWPTRVQDFTAYVQATGYQTPKGLTITRHLAPDNHWKTEERTDRDWQNPGFVQGPTHPVIGVNWEDAHAFCSWLTGTERKLGLLGRRKLYRLPTYREMMAALGYEEPKASSRRNARNSAQMDSPPAQDWFTPEIMATARNFFPWGNQWPPPKGAANIADRSFHGKYASSGECYLAGYEDGFPETSPVGNFSPNACGLFDMSGNVKVWSESMAYDGVSRAPRCTGSSWRTSAPEELASYAEGGTDRDDDTGFRCVIVLN